MNEHLRERLGGRYNNNNYSQTMHKEMKKQIITGKALFVSKSSKTSKRSIYYCKYNHIPYKVVYDFKSNSIVTVLPFDSDEYNTLKEEKLQKDIQDAISLLKHHKYIVYKNWRYKNK